MGRFKPPADRIQCCAQLHQSVGWGEALSDGVLIGRRIDRRNLRDNWTEGFVEDAAPVRDVEPAAGDALFCPPLRNRKVSH